MSPTCGIVQFVQPQSWFLLHFLMPIQNCTQLIVIIKNRPDGILYISFFFFFFTHIYCVRGLCPMFHSYNVPGKSGVLRS